MDALVSIAGKAAEYTVDPVAQQLSYLFKHKGKFQNLKIKVEELKGAGQRVKQSVHQANRNGEVIYDDVQEWLTKVNEKISEQATTQLEEDEQKAMKRCFSGFCPDFMSRYLLSKNAEKEANAIAQLLNQKSSLTEPISYRPHLECISTIRAVKGYEDFVSRKGAFDGLIAALEDDNVNVIGLYGMGGVGKTTLIKEVARQAMEKKLFDRVVLVAITQTPNMVNVQNEIAEKLGLKIEETSMDMRAVRLRDRLKKETKVLIILDDLWVTLDLEALGIPSGDEHNDCKILMTSRRLDVLESMSSRPNLSIDTLEEDEAWNLFMNMAGQIVERPDLQSTAVEVAKRCAGLPIAIATIAKALKHKHNLFQWKEALRQLREPSERNFKDIPAAAYSAIELSYKFIETEELAPVFLLCSIMARDADIEDLLRYVVGLGLFHDIKTVEDTRNKVLTLVSSLKASCLLLDGSDPTRFELHDVVRDVALSIASRDHHWFALGSDDVFKAWPDEATMKNCKLISLLQHAKVSDGLLYHELECPDITFFSMGSKDYSLNIPDNFFKGMQRLKVLNLSKMDLSSLPSSIVSLKTLSTLCLSGSKVKDVAMIGELENLEILDLHKSKIAVLPEEIGQLRRLKLLDLSDCEYLQVISPNVLSRLSRLEELYLYYSFDSWEVEGGIEIYRRRNASLAELQHLSHLTTLEVHVPDVQAMPKHNLFFRKLERYKISIGYGKWDRWFVRGTETSRMLKLKMNKSIYFIDEVQMLLKKVESLVLDGVEDVGKMFYDQSIEGLPLLKHLVVQNVSDIEDVVNSKMVSYLESLDLCNLMNLETICEHGQLKDEFFGRLRIIKVHNCQILKNLLSFSVAQMLCRQLEKIEVSECENMTELFLEEKNNGDENNILEFTRLRFLKLENLNRFNGLWYSEKTFQHATWLFDQKVTFPVLENLYIAEMENLERLWPPNQLAEHSFCKLISIDLDGCPKLLNVFPSSMLTRLQKLKHLRIWSCESVEEIIYESESQLQEGGSSSAIQSDVITTFEFPCLTYLRIWKLPNLKSMYRKMLAINWPSLKTIEVRECEKVGALFGCGETLISEKSSTAGIPIQQPLFWVNQFTFPNLHKLILGRNAGMKEIWNCNGHAQQLLSQYLRTLKVVLLSHYPEEVTKLPSYLFHLLSLPTLQTLDIRGSSFKEMMISQSEEGGEEKAACLLFSQITELSLTRLHELLHLWKEKEEFQNLRILKVDRCPKLVIDLVPSSVSFRNLETLEVSQCHGIIKLITHLTAKSLVQLKEMRISWCDAIEEIIECGDDDDDDDEISFSKLNKLTLACLPKLESFSSSGNYSFGFPYLQTLIVERCSKMKMFSQRDSNTPMLRQVNIQYWRKEERWEGSLNSTLRQLFSEHNPTFYEEDQTDSSTSFSSSKSNIGINQKQFINNKLGATERSSFK